MTRKFLTLALLLCVGGCGTVATQKREAGFDQMWHGFAAIETVPESVMLDRTISLDGWMVRIIGHPGLFTHPEYRDPIHGFAGCVFYPDLRRIEVLGKLVLCPDGRKRVVLPWAVIGHELGHVLNLIDSHIADPDKYGEWGF